MKKLNIIYIYKYASVLAIIGMLSSCDGDWLDVNDNPNSPIEPDLELLIPSVQIATAHVLADRMDAVGVLGQNMESGVSQYTLGSDGGIPLGYEELFVDALVNAERIITDAPDNDPPLTTHSAIAKTMKAYAYHVIVDLWGAAPFDEALLGAEGPDAPMWEEGSTVYPKIISLINEALAEFDQEGVAPQGDIIYAGDVGKWKKFANTLKLKMALNLDDPAMVQEAINAGVMDSNDDDADFEFGTGLAPENRHRMHQLHYTGGVKTFYMSDAMMFKMYKGYGEEGETDAVDPRMRYYFYRQLASVDGDGNPIAEPFTAAVASGKVVPDDFPCFGYAARHTNPASWTAVNCAYGYVGDGYTGRDHGDASGIPNDGNSRTTFGIYPIGGLFDDNSGRTVQQSDISTGGIYPLFTNAMTKFMQAEAALRLNVGGLDARSLLEEGIRASISDVMAFGAGASNFDANLAPIAADVENYVSAVLARYDAASTNNVAGAAGSQLDVVMDQWYIANFGNNTESFTSLRRTKLPFFRPANNPTARMSIIPSNTYPRRLPFPPSELATNPNAPDPNEVVWFQTAVFWDDNDYPDRF